MQISWTLANSSPGKDLSKAENIVDALARDKNMGVMTGDSEVLTSTPAEDVCIQLHAKVWPRSSTVPDLGCRPGFRRIHSSWSMTDHVGSARALALAVAVDGFAGEVESIGTASLHQYLATGARRGCMFPNRSLTGVASNALTTESQFILRTPASLCCQVQAAWAST